MVVYCWGPGCNGATRAALQFSRLGYAVKEMIGGFEYWAREGLEIVDERSAEPTRETFRFAGGIAEYVEFLAPDAPLTDTWRIQGAGEFSETVPVLQPDGQMLATEVRRECGVDIALRRDRHAIVSQRRPGRQSGPDRDSTHHRDRCAVILATDRMVDQIESVEATANAEAIARVDGVALPPFPGPVTTRLYDAYWALHDEPAYRDPIRYD